MIVRGVTFPPVADRVPVGRVLAEEGIDPKAVEVSHVHMSRQHAEALNRALKLELLPCRPPFYFEPRPYAVMRIGGKIWMSDHPSEVFESTPAVENARGDVLVAGLGLGVVLPPMLARDEVRSVTVLERSWAVRHLVAGAYASEPRLEVVAGDAWTWTPPRRFDSVWLDIWEDCGVSRLPEVLELCRRWRGFRRADGWTGAWNLPEMRVMRAAGRFRDENGQGVRRRRVIESATSEAGSADVIGAILAKHWLSKAHVVDLDDRTGPRAEA